MGIWTETAGILIIFSHFLKVRRVRRDYKIVSKRAKKVRPHAAILGQDVRRMRPHAAKKTKIRPHFPSLILYQVHEAHLPCDNDVRFAFDGIFDRYRYLMWFLTHSLWLNTVLMSTVDWRYKCRKTARIRL